MGPTDGAARLGRGLRRLYRMRLMQRPAGAVVTPRRRSRLPRVILSVVVVVGLAALFRFGLVPWAINPLPAIDLSQPNLWFVDWRLSAIKNNPDLCRRVLVAPHIEAQPIADSPMRDGCGWVNGVRMSTAGGVQRRLRQAHVRGGGGAGAVAQAGPAGPGAGAFRQPRRRGAELRHASPAATSSATRCGRPGAASMPPPTPSTSAASRSPTGGASP